MEKLRTAQVTLLTLRCSRQKVLSEFFGPIAQPVRAPAF
jgi:hypothetical protein